MDPPIAKCSTPQACFELFLTELKESSPDSEPQSDLPQFFEQITRIHGGTVWAKRARLYYGFWLKETAPQKATPLLLTSLKEFPILDDYIRLWLGQAYLTGELWQEAASVFQEIVDKHSDSLLSGKALYFSGEALSKMGNCKAAFPILSQALVKYPKYSNASLALFQIGNCADQLGRKTKAIEAFRELWWRYPQSSESDQAGEWLRKELEVGLFPNTVERYQRGLSLYQEGALEEAVQILQKLEYSDPHFSKGIEAQYKLAMALVRLKRYEQAEKTLLGLSQTPSSRVDDALVWLGRVYLRRGEGMKLRKMIQALPTATLSGDQQTQLYTFYGIWLEDHQQWGKAVGAYQKAAKVAHSASKRLKALWRLGWIYYQRSQFADAVTIFLKIVQETKDIKSESSLQAFSQAIYWLSLSYAHLGQAEQARQGLEVLRQSYPFSYYGQLAIMRLGSTGPLAKPYSVIASDGSKALVPLPNNIRGDIHYQKIHELEALQLFSEAVKELEKVVLRFRSDTQAFPHLISLAGEVGAYDVGIRLSIRQFGTSLRNGQLPSSSFAWAGVFPMGYQTLIQSVVPNHVDPFLVAGLIREESLYNARAVSRVGAIGLMQLMPTTATRVAHQLGIQGSDYQQSDLYDPQQNIRLGTHYLGQLLKEFQGHIIYSVAAYNAGPHVVKRWITQSGHRPPDEFVELIGYPETRGYVKRVVGSYRIYRTLFGEVCQGVNLDRYC